MTCPCPNPANCSPTFCHFTEADLSGMKVQMLGPEEPDPSAALIARANRHIRMLEADRAQLLAMYDAPGNALDDFAKWWGNRAWWEQIGYVCGLVLSLGMAVSLAVGWK